MATKTQNKRYDYFDAGSISTLTLEYGQTLCVDFREETLDLQRLRHDSYLDSADRRGELVHRYMCNFLSDQPNTLRFTTPATAWDHIKATWLKRLVRLRLLQPAKMHTESVEVKDVFPFNKMKFPDTLGTHVRIVHRQDPFDME